LPAAAQKPDMKGGTVVASEPGKAAIVGAAEVSAQIVSIDKKTRTVSLKGPKGKVTDIVAGDEVKNFDQIKVGDRVVVRYMQSLALELQKVKSNASGIQVTEGAAKAEPGQRPAVGAVSEVTAIAKVSAIDPKAKTISLTGPRGNTVTLDVKNPDQFKVVKMGDEVLVTYTEAVAVSVEPAAKKAAPKKDAKK
jgi:ribosomal 50S subunit-recycling heat shock protein